MKNCRTSFIVVGNIPSQMARADTREIMENELIEKLAEYSHGAWSGWMHYMFSKGTMNDDGTWTMQYESVLRWKRQMQTPYESLPENEKMSDRKEAYEILKIIEKK